MDIKPLTSASAALLDGAEGALIFGIAGAGIVGIVGAKAPLILGGCPGMGMGIFAMFWVGGGGSGGMLACIGGMGNGITCWGYIAGT